VGHINIRIHIPTKTPNEAVLINKYLSRQPPLLILVMFATAQDSGRTPAVSASTGAGNLIDRRQYALLRQRSPKRLNLSKKTLRNWRSKGKGPHYLKIEEQIRYRLVDVEAFEKKGMER
jgi:Helix-turn-helix domain